MTQGIDESRRLHVSSWRAPEPDWRNAAIWLFGCATSELLQDDDSSYDKTHARKYGQKMYTVFFGWVCWKARSARSAGTYLLCTYMFSSSRQFIACQMSQFLSSHPQNPAFEEFRRVLTFSANPFKFHKPLASRMWGRTSGWERSWNRLILDASLVGFFVHIEKYARCRYNLTISKRHQLDVSWNETNFAQNTMRLKS